jgi:hypothetical protein
LVVESPVNTALAAAKRDQIAMFVDPQPSDLRFARDAFHNWVPERTAVAGLPRPGDAEFHALDCILWCAARLTLERRSELAPLLPLELKAYPPIFATVFAETTAGFEALVVVLERYAGLSSEALRALGGPGNVRDHVLAPAVALLETVFRLTADDDGRDQFTPFDVARLFVRANRDGLSLLAGCSGSTVPRALGLTRPEHRRDKGSG